MISNQVNIVFLKKFSVSFEICVTFMLMLLQVCVEPQENLIMKNIL